MKTWAKVLLAVIILALTCWIWIPALLVLFAFAWIFAPIVVIALIIVLIVALGKKRDSTK